MKKVAIIIKKSILIITLIALVLQGYAQKGIPFITNYTLPISMSAQNYQIIQGANNTMYILNQNGVFSFDGYGWERMPIAGQPIAMTFIDNLFVGGDQVVGYFKKNLKGVNVYVPVGEKNPDLYYLFHHFNNNLYTAGVDGVYRIRRVEPYKIDPYYTEKDNNQIVTDMFNVGEKFFIVKNKTSIYKISKQDATPINLNIGNNEEILFTFKHKDYQIIGTSSNRVFKFDGDKLTPIFIKDQKYLDASYLTSGISLNNNTIAFATLIGGSLIINSDNGDTKHIINYSNGLPDDEVTAMGKDNQGGLWLIHGMGISRVDLSIPISSYNHIAGLKGNILSISKQNKDLFVGTSDGLYRLTESKSVINKPSLETFKPIDRKISVTSNIANTADSKSKLETSQEGKKKKGLFSRLFGRDRNEQAVKEVVSDDQLTDTRNLQSSSQKTSEKKRLHQVVSTNYSFERISGINGKVNHLINWKGNLLAASSTGLYNVYLGQPTSIISNNYVYSLCPSSFEKNSIYVGTWESLYIVSNSNSSWTNKEIISFPTEKILSIAEQSATSIMVSTDYRVYKIDGINTAAPTYRIVSTANNNLVSPIVRKTQKGIIVITPTQIFSYYQEGDSIGINDEFPKSGNYKSFYSDAEQTWIRIGQQWMDYPKSASNKRIAKYLGLLDRVNYINYSDSNEVWVVNGYSQLYKVTPSSANDTIDIVNLYIKQVIDKTGNSLNTNYIKLESTNNAFKIKLGAPFYLKEKAIEYQYKLEGVMAEWSDWGNTPERDFPFFPPGNHTLQFRARDAMGNISEIQEYPFSITPPFYQTVWFYIIVFAVLVSLITLYIKVREKNLIKEKQILEQKVKERTKTIEEQKEAIELQRDELKVRNVEILQKKEEIEAQRDEITTQRDQIISQNQDIIKSISYARRIQTAVMPSKERADSILNNYFILLKPRDIVSGDFYWMTQKDGKIIVTAADCTGHGVPGAFMSLMGITLLTEIVKNTEDIRPHIILNNLRTNLKRALSQVGKEHEAKDGMDIALSVIDPKENKLMFAGAYNPLYLVRNSELIEYKGDKMPVGVHINEKETFTLHEIDLQKNDCIYMFSDGYVDQFGGNDNRKFMSKNFKELLLKISTKEMQEQKTILDDNIDQWIGPHDQLDDILVLGIRIQ